MSAFQTGGGRLRAYLEFIAAVVYFFLARALAHHEALGLVNEQWIVEQWAPLIEQLVLFFLLLVGYASMGVALDRQSHPLSEQGLPRRPGWPSEAGLGLDAGAGLRSAHAGLWRHRHCAHSGSLGLGVAGG